MFAICNPEDTSPREFGLEWLSSVSGGKEFTPQCLRPLLLFTILFIFYLLIYHLFFSVSNVYLFLDRVRLDQTIFPFLTDLVEVIIFFPLLRVSMRASFSFLFFS